MFSDVPKLLSSLVNCSIFGNAYRKEGETKECRMYSRLEPPHAVQRNTCVSGDVMSYVPVR